MAPVAKKTLLVSTAALLTAVAVGWLGFTLADSDAGTPVPVRRTPVAAAPSAPPEATPRPSADLVIAAAAPLRLRVPAIGVDSAVSEYSQQMIDDRGGFDPPELSTVSWDTTIQGGTSGTDSTNTVYLYGHSWVDEAVFNGIRVMKAGDVAGIDTERGTLCYVTQKTLTLNKAEYKINDELTDAIPNRLVLVSCYRPVGYDPNSATVKNVVAVLQLDQAQTNSGC